MPSELPLLLIDETPPANLADLIALRAQVLDTTTPPPAVGEPVLAGAWERWRNGVLQLAARFQAHPCRGPDCAKCAEVYATLQVLEARKHHLVAFRRAQRVRWLWLPQPPGEA